jgi:hypothetical protein
MKPSRAVLALSIAAGILLPGCKDHGSEVVPEREEPIPVVLKVEVDPDSGIVGSAITLRCPGFVSPDRDYWVYFPGADDSLRAKATPDSTISTFVPFGARSGEIVVTIGQNQGRTASFHVEHTVDTTMLSVAPYDISAPVTAKDSSVIDFMGILRSWKADRQGDTLHLHRRYSVGEGSYEYHVVLIDQGSSVLPRLAAVWTHVDTDYNASWDEPNHVGVLKLQDYRVNGVISGRFFGKASTRHMLNGTMVFWVDLGR